LPRIYTRTGDGGETGLLDGSRTSKSDPRVDLYGDVDELNSAIGLALATGLDQEAAADLRGALEGIQRDLFELGALLADPARCEALAAGGQLTIDGAALEPVIDRLDSALPPAAAALHLARTVCRRVERKAVDRRRAGVAVPGGVIVYLNRLSDLLFTAARFANHAAGCSDVEWSGKRPAD
jgi:cob(I)alamin adenosyltransferase